MPIMAKCTGSISTARDKGSRIGAQMMMAGMASKKQPTTRKTKELKKPVARKPICQAETPVRIASGIW